GRSQIGAYHSGQDSKQVHRIIINLVSGAAGHPDAVGAKGCAKPARASGLIVPDIKHKIVFDNVIIPAGQTDSVSRPGRRIIVANAADLVAIYGNTGAAYAQIDAPSGAART